MRSQKYGFTRVGSFREPARDMLSKYITKAKIGMATGAIIPLAAAFVWVLITTNIFSSDTLNSADHVTAPTSSESKFQCEVVDLHGPINPWTKITGDLDGDGRDEIIVGGQKGPLVWYRWPQFDKYKIADGGWHTVGGTVADVDGDRDLDIVLGGTLWFENPGNLSAEPERLWLVHRIAEDPTHDVAAGDFDGDGRLDVVTRNQSEFGARSGNRIRVWLQRSDSRWEGREISCPHGEGLAVADLDSDGDPDIVIGGLWFETISEGDAPSWKAHEFAQFHRNATVAVADFSGDGRPDVALAPSELAGQHDRLSWFEAPSDPKTSPWTEHRLVDQIEAVIHSLVAADFDGDRRPDIAYAEMHQGADPDEVVVLINRFDRPWPKILLSTTGSHNLQTLDADGDGAPDLLGANWSGPQQKIELWLNRMRASAEGGRK